MMKSGRPLVSTQPLASIALMSLLAISLALSAACRADDVKADTDAAAAGGPEAPVPGAAVNSAAAATPRVSSHRPATHRTVAQSIDENVRRLARGLDLDPSQQEKLRLILLDQHRQMMQLRTGGAASGDVTGTTLAIYAETRGRIRAVLNDEQKSKYSADVPRDTLAPAQADLQHWMQIQESSRKQGVAATQ